MKARHWARKVRSRAAAACCGVMRTPWVFPDALLPPDAAVRMTPQQAAAARERTFLAQWRAFIHSLKGHFLQRYAAYKRSLRGSTYDSILLHNDDDHGGDHDDHDHGHGHGHDDHSEDMDDMFERPVQVDTENEKALFAEFVENHTLKQYLRFSAGYVCSDLLALGLRGRAVGAALQACLDAVMDERVANERAALLAYAAENLHRFANS